MLTLTAGIIVFIAATYTLRKDIKRLEKENERLRGITKELRKQMSQMIERPF